MREGKNGRSGRTCTFVAREGVAFTARCNCSYATLRWKNVTGGLGRDSHPRPSPYEGAALTAAPPSRKGRARRPRRAVALCADENLEISASDTRDGSARRLALPVNPAAGGLAPPSAESKSAVFLLDDTAENGPDGGTRTPDHSRPRRACWLLHYIRLCGARGAAGNLNRPGGVPPSRCCYLLFYLAAQGATVVIGACNQHETGNRNPRNREGNSDHGVVLSISIMALLRGASAVANRRRFPRWVRPRKNGAGRVEVTQLRLSRRAGFSPRRIISSDTS